MKLPLSTAPPVAMQCATIAPAHTNSGFCAAESAMVVSCERSPSSAAAVSANASPTSASLPCLTPVFSSSSSASSRSSSMPSPLLDAASRSDLTPK